MTVELLRGFFKATEMRSGENRMLIVLLLGHGRGIRPIFGDPTYKIFLHEFKDCFSDYI